jgi:hypothetical protein
MMTIFSDESHDAHTYALGGWAITPTHWRLFGEEWKAMLGIIAMPNGEPCPAFHASAMMNNQKGSFKGWGRVEAENAFEKATAVIERNRDFSMSPMGVAVEIPADFASVQRDSVWLILFSKFFQMVLEAHPTAQSVEFVFDNKPEIADHASMIHDTVTRALEETYTGVFLERVDFVADETSPQVQAADLLMYEWRKRITDARLNPTKAPRPWFERIRAARPGGTLWRYGREIFDEALKAEDQSKTWAHAIMYGPPTHRD